MHIPQRTSQTVMPVHWPMKAPAMAPYLLHLLHIMQKAIGNTAEPMSTPAEHDEKVTDEAMKLSNATVRRHCSLQERCTQVRPSTLPA